MAQLTEREREVLQLVADGLTDKEIARKLFISKHTVSHYVKMLLYKFCVANRIQLAVKFTNINN